MKEILKRRDGSVLIIAVIVIMILAGLSAALLTVSTAQSRAVSITEDSFKAFYIAEAGISAGISEITSGTDSDKDGEIGSVASVFASGNFAVTAVQSPAIGADHWTISSVGDFSDRQRGVEAVIGPAPSSPFQQSLFGDLDMTLAGNVFSDSYDSADGTYAAQAVNVDPWSGETYANTNGDIGSNSDVTVTGGVTIFGDLTPGMNGSVTVSGGGALIYGSTAPRTEPAEFESYEYDPPATPADPSPSSGTTLTDGTYHFDELKIAGGGVITLDGDIVIYVDNNISVNGTVNILPGSNVTIHHGTGSISFAGNGIVNGSQDPSVLDIFSASTTTVKIAGSSDFYGTIYAPEAQITPSGNSATYGAMIGKTLKINGTPRFHYDEALGRKQYGPLTYEQKSWREFVPVAGP